MDRKKQLPLDERDSLVFSSGDAVEEKRPMRHVLFVIDQLCELGGAERILLNTIRLLPNDRFRCSLLTFKVDPSIHISEHVACPHFVWPLRKVYDWNAARIAFQLRKFLRDEKVDIVHTFFETSDLWAGLISKLSAPVKLVSSRRDMGILRSPKHSLGYRVMNPWFDLVLTVSEEVRRFAIQEDHLPEGKVATLYNGLELERTTTVGAPASLRSSFGLDACAPIVVTVGHIRRVKGIDILVEVAALVAREFPSVIFLVVGRNSDPMYYREIEETIERRNLQKNVILHGEYEDIFSVLNMCDVFYLPSRSEGFSNALIEAMACGLPCVATTVGGNKEAIEEGRSGYLVENEDAEAAADRIVGLLRNPGRAKQMGSAGRQIVERQFTAEVMMERLTAFYDRLLAAKRP